MSTRQARVEREVCAVWRSSSQRRASEMRNVWLILSRVRGAGGGSHYSIRALADRLFSHGAKASVIIELPKNIHRDTQNNYHVLHNRIANLFDFLIIDPEKKLDEGCPRSASETFPHVASPHQTA
jgi:hypothetical protein